MLFNCFKCGKSISSKKDVCVYCRSDVSQFTVEFNNQRQPSTSGIKEKYAGTLLAMLFKTKTR